MMHGPINIRFYNNLSNAYQVVQTLMLEEYWIRERKMAQNLL